MSNFSEKSQSKVLHEAGLVLVEAKVNTALAWRNLSDVGESKLAKTLDFGQLKGKKIYAKFVRKGNQGCWEMHIDAFGVKSIVYVDTFVLGTEDKT